MLEPNLLTKLIIYIIEYSPHIATLLFFYILLEVFIWKPEREYKAYQKFIGNVYQTLLETQGEEIANDYLKFKEEQRRLN